MFLLLIQLHWCGKFIMKLNVVREEWGIFKRNSSCSHSHSNQELKSVESLNFAYILPCDDFKNRNELYFNVKNGTKTKKIHYRGIVSNKLIPGKKSIDRWFVLVCAVLAIKRESIFQMNGISYKLTWRWVLKRFSFNMVFKWIHVNYCYFITASVWIFWISLFFCMFSLMFNVLRSKPKWIFSSLAVIVAR